MNLSRLSISTQWERAALTEFSGAATLMIRVVAPEASRDPGTRPPLDIAFVIDRSGSMSGRPIELAKQAVSHATGLLEDPDRATLVVYDDQVDVIHRLSGMSSRGRNELRLAQAHVVSGGSTDLCAGWLMGCRELARDQRTSGAERVSRTILLTDGLANQGETSPRIIFEHAAELRHRRISTTTLGMGDHFDESLLAGMAEAGGGNFAYIESASQLSRTFERELGRLVTTTATQLNLRLQFPDGVHGKLLNPFPVERHGRRFDVAIDDLSSNDEVVLIFEVTGRGLILGDRMPFELSLRWTDPTCDERQTVNLPVQPLEVVDRRVYEAMPSDDETAAQAALVRAAAAQREAMELDRAGRRQESRALHAAAFDLLAAAPLQDENAHLREEARAYAAYDAGLSFSEHSRKQATHNAVQRTRRGSEPQR